MNCDKRIILGYPLDLIFDRTCRYSDYEDLINNYSLGNGLKLKDVNREIENPESIKQPKGNFGGIILPKSDSPGTGNIIIRGKPGTAKSTFALQLACTAVQDGNDTSSFYITLEESAENVIKKCKQFGWENSIKPLDQMGAGFQIDQCQIENVRTLEEIFVKKSDISLEEPAVNGKNSGSSKRIFTPQVIVSTLRPRDIFKIDDNEDLLFHSRYDQLENLLISINLYNEHNGYQVDNLICKDDKPVIAIRNSTINSTEYDSKIPPRIGMVFIDSLNVFGEKLLSRDQLFRLFDLFKQYGVLGVFIVEEDEKSIYTQERTHHSETIEYISDMVISLTVSEEEGYTFRYFEISKSRYQHQVYGKHPFKIYEPDKKTDEPRVAVKVFPSLHFLVYGTNIEYPGPQKGENTDQKKVFCEENANFYLPSGHKGSKSILIEGPRETFKTSLARDFLMRGLISELPSSVIMIRFQDYYTEGNKLRSFRISKSCREELEYSEQDPREHPFQSFYTENLPDKFWKHNDEIQTYWEGFKLNNSVDITTKRFLRTYTCNVSRDKDRIIEKNYTDLIYQSGYLLPEEFMQILLETIIAQRTRDNLRIVLDDIGRIGSSYPLLYKSKFSGEIFLAALFHIIRNYRIRLLITGTTGDYNRSDEVIEKVRTLVDDVLTTKKIHVFGDNFVTLQGGTLTSSDPTDDNDSTSENVPGVIIPSGKYGFRVDGKIFTGLVGFDTDKIIRPEIKLYFNKENDLHEYYNEEVKRMLKYAFAQDVENVKSDKSIATLLTESSREGTATIFDSLGLLGGKPIKSTVIVPLDEFFTAKEKASFVRLKRKDNINIYKEKYYNNVLLLAVNRNFSDQIDIIKSELISHGKMWNISTWQGLEEILEIAGAIQKRNFNLIDFSPEITETQVCILLDAFSQVYPGNQLGDLFFNLITSGTDPNYVIPAAKKLIQTLMSLKNAMKTSPKVLHWTELSPSIKRELDIMLGRTKDKVGMMNREDYLSHDKLKTKGLIPESLFYICWYSELRMMLFKHPELAPKIEVFSLPGGGFKGDWSLAILKGSVSETLGDAVIKMLCDRKEDFKRYLQGIGLPTENSVFTDKTSFMAWPGSMEHVKLSDIFRIHKDALRRSELDGYLNLRLALSALFRELILMKSERDIKTGIVDRLPDIFSSLFSDDEKEELKKEKLLNRKRQAKREE
jgi:KaiC/GvpD/RAD55 family RecA-like ATPase